MKANPPFTSVEAASAAFNLAASQIHGEFVKGVKP